jgi:hypothetical protein
MVIFLLISVLFSFQYEQTEAGPDSSNPVFIPYDRPNEPLGEGRGIYPGRVSWVHDPEAVLFSGNNGKYWEKDAVNQDAVDGMFDRALCMLSGEGNSQDAWDAFFRQFNHRRDRGELPYEPGQKIAVKINMNTSNGYDDNDKGSNTSPHVILGLARQLVNHAGVPDTCICFYDVSRPVPDYVADYVWKEFPDIRFLDPKGENGRMAPTKDSLARVIWSQELTLEEGGGHDTFLPTVVSNADYIINLGNLKGHDLAGVTICAKNHVGTLMATNPDNPYLSAPRAAGIHPYIAAHDFAYWKLPKRDTATYTILADLMGHRDLGEKTLLFVVDALFAVNKQHADVTSGQKWDSPPFSGDFTSSLFLSMDGVAIESVGLDFLRNEPTMDQVYGNVDNYLHEASQAHAPPSGTVYDPEGDGTPLTSLGAHEHWDSPESRKYSVNLGMGKGIELLTYRMGEGIPEVPSGLEALAAGEGLVLLTWEDHSVNEHGFLLERREIGQDFFSEVAIIPMDHVRFTDTLSEPEGSFEYRLLALGDEIHSDYSQSAWYNATGKRTINRQSEGSLQIYPNPATSSTRIRILNPGQGDVILSILTMDGRVVKEVSFTRKGKALEREITLQGIRPGVYLVIADTDQERLSQKLVVR